MFSMFSRLSKGLAKTKANLVDGITSVVQGRRLDDEVLEELEEQLLLSDVGVSTTERIIEDLRDNVRQERDVTPEKVITLVKKDLMDLFEPTSLLSPTEDNKPYVISVVGVNGTGKTTTIGKLAHHFRSQDKKVLMAAADTFRAAAIDQLEIWAERSRADMLRSIPGADPASVSFDAVNAAIARGIDVVLLDTAGRLHTKTNLMAELEKIHRVLKKRLENAPHEILLVLDATTGQNGLSQAKQFAATVDVTGIVLTKLDGTAKGGIIFSIAHDLNIPVRYLGVGEGIEDLQEFNPQTFVEALFQ